MSLKLNQMMTAGLLCASSSVALAADSVTEALTEGKAYGDFRLRYEAVDQDNALKDASALTLRSRLGYTTGVYQGFSATMEMEDSSVVSQVDDYNNTNGKNAGVYSVIADPETTELDQAFLQYSAGNLTAKLGRQVLTLDGHRHVGHVGWRQDRQVFDALTLRYKPAKSVALTAAYIQQRNRIFAEQKDMDAKDVLLNASYTAGWGKLTGYGYFLEEDKVGAESMDTLGVSYQGKTKLDSTTIKYRAEFSRQDFADNQADYLALEGAASFAGITATVGYEKLGSDDGSYGFQTPLATLHKFNGWADLFLNTNPYGLVDIYVGVAGKALGGKWKLVYHDFSADDDATVDDLGSELNLLYARKFAKHYNAGVKYAAYSAGDAAAGRVDTNKLWLWVGAKF